MKTTLTLLLTALATSALAANVQVTGSHGNWQLMRDGKPYFVKGAGGGHSRAELAKAGANSFRTWGSDNLKAQLDEAQKHGLTVTVGFWLGHERHGFNYRDKAALARQEKMVRDTVAAYKDHPAVLIWALGNEMEMGCSAETEMWTHINRLAEICKELDPNHPTMTVIAELGGNKVKNLNTLCPSLDIIGINSYGGSPSIAERWIKDGGDRPFILTEFGPPGVWEMGPTKTGAPAEWTSTRKAEWYEEVYKKSIESQRGKWSLGSYAFIWGHKVESTPTWYGMFLPDGSRLGAVEAMTRAWGGPAPANRCPITSEITISPADGYRAGDTITATAKVSDPDGDKLAYLWTVRADVANYNTAGDDQADPAAFPAAIIEGQGTPTAKIKLPGGGILRIFLYTRDGHGNAAVANIAIKAEGAAPQIGASKSALPFTLNADGAPKIFHPSGYMGNTGAITINESSAANPRTGATCIEITYTASDKWAGVWWQSPANDWGDQPGGLDLSGATMLEFWARGKNGGEKVSFNIGGIGSNKKYHDTAKAELKNVVLKPAWTRYRIPLDGQDMSRIKTPFGWTLGGQGKPVTFYIDDIRFTAD